MKTGLTENQLEYFRKCLERELDEAEENLRKYNAASDVVKLDQQAVGRLSRMDAIQMQSMARATDQMRRRRSHLATQALKRLEAGSFGICTECGEPIAIPRLEFDPVTALCIECAT